MKSSLVWIVASVVCSSLAHFALKLGAMRMGQSDVFTAAGVLRVASNGWLVGGMLLHVTALGLWVAGLRSVELSLAYPFIALGFVLVSLLAWMFLGETLSASRVLAMAMIAAALVLLVRS